MYQRRRIKLEEQMLETHGLREITRRGTSLRAGPFSAKATDGYSTLRVNRSWNSEIESTRKSDHCTVGNDIIVHI